MRALAVVTLSASPIHDAAGGWILQGVGKTVPFCGAQLQDLSFGLRGHRLSSHAPAVYEGAPCDNRAMRRVGRRKDLPSALADQGALARTAAALRGTSLIVARGVYRFRTFEEADAWMSEMSSPKTSSASAAP